MRAFVPLIVLAALVFIGFGTYVTFQKRRESERLRQMETVARRTRAARNNSIAPDKLAPVGSGVEKFEPRHDLGKIAVALANTLDKKAYEQKGVTIATKIPRRWFETADKAELDRILSRTRGTVTIHAGKVGAPAGANPTLMVYLCETSGESDRTWLTKALRRQNNDASLAVVSVREVLCVVVERAAPLDTKPRETIGVVEGLAQGFLDVLEARLGPAK